MKNKEYADFLIPFNIEVLEQYRQSRIAFLEREIKEYDAEYAKSVLPRFKNATLEWLADSFTCSAEDAFKNEYRKRQENAWTKPNYRDIFKQQRRELQDWAEKLD